MRPIAVGRHNWTFAGSDRGGERAAAIYTLIETCRMNGVDPRAWLADILRRLPGQPHRRSPAMELEKAGRIREVRPNCSQPGSSADAYLM